MQARADSKYLKLKGYISGARKRQYPTSWKKEEEMSVRDYLKSKYSESEWNEMEQEADIFVSAIKSLQESIKNELVRIMEEQDIGIRDIREKLGISQATAKKLVLGRNVNFDTLLKHLHVNVEDSY